VFDLQCFKLKYEIKNLLATKIGAWFRIPWARQIPNSQLMLLYKTMPLSGQRTQTNMGDIFLVPIINNGQPTCQKAVLENGIFMLFSPSIMD
jgi:hypothetical protein